ncbi:uncharacterized protein LOC130897427 [Diorhabda carinulata]|uniref:uncharacterized protein LOC130897427 n=1 Tax=Diorhabda carinulata TaxID=1163345 RepID=UPI0025A0E1A1|nr:uncharacterized protein LOC130897427 [Diorhabda carinulata]
MLTKVKCWEIEDNLDTELVHFTDDSDADLIYIPLVSYSSDVETIEKTSSTYNRGNSDNSSNITHAQTSVQDSDNSDDSSRQNCLIKMWPFYWKHHTKAIQENNPEIIHFYNDTKGDVDALDKKVHRKRRCYKVRKRRCLPAIRLRLIDIAGDFVANANLLYLSHSSYRRLAGPKRVKVKQDLLNVKPRKRQRQEAGKLIESTDPHFPNLYNLGTMHKISTRFNEIQMRYDNHLNLLDEFDKIQSIIESECKEDDLDEQFNERDTFQDRYYAAFDFLKQFIQTLQPRLDTSVEQNSNSVNNISSNNFDPLQNVLLPKLKLLSFDGEFHHWLQFKTNFKTIICDNTNLNENQKFQFLKASLEGYASRFIEGLDSTDKPFERAWNLLGERFDKKQFLIDSHFKSILSVQNIVRENYIQFRKLLDENSKHLTSLEGLELTKDILYDSFIIYIVSNKLDKNTIRDWKEMKYHSELPTLDEFMNFLKDKSDILQCLDESQQSTKSIGNLSKNKNNPVHMLLSTNKSLSCNYCKQAHTIYKCPQFSALNVDTKIHKIKNLHLCENCLLAGHDKQNCKHGKCTICKRKHNTLLHKQYNVVPPANNPSNKPTTSMNVVVNHNNSNTILKAETFANSLLSTVSCQIKDNQGNFHQIRALLDCGAQSNIITERLCSLLNIPLLPTNVSISGIGKSVSYINKKSSISLYSCVNDHEYTISCLVVPVITGNIPFAYFNPSTLKIPEHVQLSDPSFGCPQEVDLLLGANIFWDLLLNEKIKLGNNMLVNTVFGWIVTGALPIDNNKTIMCNLSSHIPEDDQLKKFWEIEEIKGSNQFLSQDDIVCESLFNENTFRIENGQFVVKFPLKQSPELLGRSKPEAIRRFKTLEKRFADVQFKQLYTDFIQEYETLGHMTKLTIEPDGIKYFLPHHGILKEMSTTTRLRVVFDGSCETSTGWSLNDLQYIGPKVQNDIINILLRFRTYKFVVSADISKMYRQILIDREHRPLQQILWRDNPKSNFCTYHLNTVTYGTRSAPYLAIKCIKTLAEHNMNQYPKACETILKDMYVDDLLTGSNDLIELQKLCKDIYDVLSSANFILRKWISNNFQVVCGFKDNNISNAILDIGDKESCKTLGIQ